MDSKASLTRWLVQPLLDDLDARTRQALGVLLLPIPTQNHELASNNGPFECYAVAKKTIEQGIMGKTRYELLRDIYNLLPDSLRRQLPAAVANRLRNLSPVEPGGLSHEAYGRELRSRMQTPPWCVDKVQLGPDFLQIEGWGIAPEGKHDRIRFTVNDQPFERVDFPTPRDDIQRIF